MAAEAGGSATTTTAWTFCRECRGRTDRCHGHSKRGKQNSRHGFFPGFRCISRQPPAGILVVGGLSRVGDANLLGIGNPLVTCERRNGTGQDAQAGTSARNEMVMSGNGHSHIPQLNRLVDGQSRVSDDGAGAVFFLLWR